MPNPPKKQEKFYNFVSSSFKVSDDNVSSMQVHSVDNKFDMHGIHFVHTGKEAVVGISPEESKIRTYECNH